MEQRELTKKEKNELKKMFPKIPKKRLGIKEIIEAIKNYDGIVNEFKRTVEINKSRQETIFRLQKENQEKEDILILKKRELKRLENKVLEKE